MPVEALQSCPWSGLAPASISFCEARLCAWIAEPSNALSNVAYVLPGVWVARQRALALPIRVMTASAAVTLACTSFFFHSTGSRVGELLDVSSMYVLPALSVGVSLADEGKRLLGMVLPLLVWAGATGLMAATGSDGIVAWGLLGALAVWLESQRARLLPAQGRWLDVTGVLVAFGVGYGIWWLDKLGIACDPDNHVLTGHAVWHCCTAASIGFFYRHQVKVARARAA